MCQCNTFCSFKIKKGLITASNILTNFYFKFCMYSQCYGIKIRIGKQLFVFVYQLCVGHRINDILYHRQWQIVSRCICTKQPNSNPIFNGNIFESVTFFIIRKPDYILSSNYFHLTVLCPTFQLCLIHVFHFYLLNLNEACLNSNVMQETWKRNSSPIKRPL